MRNPFRYFNSPPEVIRLPLMMYIRYPPLLRQVEDLLFERGIDINHETVRFWWNRFGPMFATEIRKRRARDNRCYSQWRWHLKTLQKFAAVHASINNHFNQDCHLIRPDIFRQSRSAALAERRQLAA